MKSINELIYKFGTPISFKDIGRVTDSKIPSKPALCFMNSTSCYAPDMEFSNLKPIIESILIQIEGLKFNWDENYFIWRIEWGTPNKENGLDYKSAAIIRHGRLIANITACEALKRFPELIDEDQGTFLKEEYEKWSKIELRVYFDIKKEKIFIESNRMTGCPRSYNNFWNQFKDALDNI
jgi:hypothetical protein